MVEISGRRGHPPPTILRVGKLDEFSFMWYKNVGRELLRFVTVHAFDRRTDGQTDAHRKDRVHTMQRGKKWKTTR